RDEETAEMAIHSALTGHLVLSTLHTMNAAGSFARLSDMKAKPFLISSTVNVVIAQRLARKICSNCIEEYKLDKVAIGVLESQYNIPEIIKTLVKEKVIDKEKSLAEINFYRGKGCDHCDMQGYKGRVGIFEVLDVNEAIKDLIVGSASAEKIQAQAVRDGMLTMIQDGFVKVVSKVTTIEEILRITKE
ncbi:MAG: Flp pilus assembly complex ATPase component TadA, partial [Parcubacteria group bacterium]|nr:Flp pilus assembly complex ATPase component TadA [Parcubacteria group bacterium]